MHIERLGFARLKGTRHLALETIELDERGPVGDREFCLVDLVQRRVLRTVENPTLTALTLTREGSLLTLEMPDGDAIETDARDAADGGFIADYWGCGARLTLQASALSEAVSRHLDREVTLARAERGDVVYDDPVSIVTTGALARLAEMLRDAGYAVPPALDERFRATITLDTDQDLRPGMQLELGEAVVEIGDPLERCAVVDIDPVTGSRGETPVMAHLLAPDGRLLFGHGARVIRAGRIHRTA